MLSYFTATCDQAFYNSPVNPDWMGSGWYRFVDTAGKERASWHLISVRSRLDSLFQNQHQSSYVLRKVVLWKKCEIKNTVSREY